MISLTRAGFENSLQSSFRWMVIRDLCESGVKSEERGRPSLRATGPAPSCPSFSTLLLFPRAIVQPCPALACFHSSLIPSPAPGTSASCAPRSSTPRHSFSPPFSPFSLFPSKPASPPTFPHPTHFLRAPRLTLAPPPPLLQARSRRTPSPCSSTCARAPRGCTSGRSPPRCRPP